MRSRVALALAGACAAIAVMAIVAFSVGRFPISVIDFLSVLWAGVTGGQHGLDPTVEAVIYQIRAPRVAAALLIGAALSGAGAAYQNMFRNPLVSPDILGVSAGAAMGAVLGIFLSLNVIAIQSLAFAFGLLAVGLVYVTANAVRGHDPLLVLVLAGVVIGSLLGACVALMKYLADPYNQLPAITFWLLGSLASSAPQDVWSTLPLILVGLVPLWLAIAAIGRDVVITAGAITYNSLFGALEGHPTPISKLNTLCQIVFVLLVVAAHAIGHVPQDVVTGLGALVFVTTVVSGIDYVLTYSRKAVHVSRRRRGLPFGMDDAGRWALVRRPRPVQSGKEVETAAVEHLAWTLLRRYGVVFWRLLEREAAALLKALA